MRTIASTIVLSGCVAAVLGLAGCGGHKQASTTVSETGGGDDEGGGGTANPCSDGMCPPEVLDNIQSQLDHKRTAAARCLSEAVNAGKLKKDAHGSVALSFVIGKNGKARDVKVTDSSIKNGDVEGCVASKIEEIDFGAVPKDLDWSYTFAFEAM